MKRIAVYPGSFDPLHNGHIDIIERALTLFDTVIVALLCNPEKSPLFSVDKRIDMINRSLSDERVHVEAFNGLIASFATKQGALSLIRGLRAISDFEFEFQMALMNRRLSPNLETIFLMPREEYTYLSSRIVKEIALLGGSVDGLVPDVVKKELRMATKNRK